jgi:pimeloyl-ACP methyl ester carboxylesterase
VRLRADVVGDDGAPPAVLLHGGGQTRHSWGPTAELLGERGWQAYAVDLRGHGDSEWPSDGDYSLDAFSGDVRAIATSLPQPPVLIGASLGGVSSLAAQGEAPTPIAAGLILVDVAPRIEQAGADRIGDFMRGHMEDGFANLEEVADAIAEYNPNRPRPSNVEGLRKNVRQRADGRWVWHWDPRFLRPPHGTTGETRSTSLVAAERLEAAARALTIPTLLVRGRLSDLLSEEGARRFLELAPDAEYVNIEGAGHMIAGDRNDVFNDGIFDFLDRRIGRPGSPPG